MKRIHEMTRTDANAAHDGWSTEDVHPVGVKPNMRAQTVWRQVAIGNRCPSRLNALR